MERILTYAEAIHEATEQEMARDASVIVLGLGVDDFRGIYGTTKGLVDKFGHERVFDTPLSEDAMTGVSIGAALAGLRPIHVHIRMDFLLLAMNQIINIAAKSHYMYGGTVSVPIVVRSIIGRSWGQGAQHSQGLQALFMHIPGLRVVAPSTPYDAKGCLITSIRDNNPIMFVEHRMLHYLKGHVPEEDYAVPFGKARVLATGTDITIVGISYMVVECMRVQHQLAKIGIRGEVIDPVSLSPLDIDTIVESVKKTGRLLIVDSAWTLCGASAEIMAQVTERLQGIKDLRVRRMGFAPVICPP
ncbi:MAG: alpha-ketoacid dehydrogenase subunit beta, partial [Nitrososphaera sp.]|nr:alpha-ketoacid dehydrogenase subunit beta [Nitrososphaera sp.]